MERMRFRKMNGYGSKAAPRDARISVLRTTQQTSHPPKRKMNVHDPPNAAIRSAARSPKVQRSRSSLFRSRGRLIRWRTPSITSRSWGVSCFHSARKMRLAAVPGLGCDEAPNGFLLQTERPAQFYDSGILQLPDPFARDA